MGKKPVLKRNFGILSILGFSCTILGTWEGLLGTFVGPLTNGGSGGAIYAYIFGWVGCFANFMVLSELASMAPTAGGQYHWAAMLAPIKHQKFLGFITGWFAVLGWQSAFAACAFLTGKMIQGAAILGNNLYNALPWQGTLIVWGSLSLSLAVNLLGGNLLPRAEAALLVLHIIGFFGILIPLVYMADHNTKEQVFLSFQNGGGFATQGLSWFVGMTSCAFAFAGGDAAVHMSEEVANASTVIPHALMISVGINGSLGFGMIIAMMFCADADLGGKLGSITGYNFMGIFIEATNSVPGSLAMCAIVITIYVCSLMGLLAAASRQLWSFSRDRGVPGWRLWSQVSSGKQLPVYAILVTVTIAVLLSLINIGSNTAMEDVVSMAVSGIYLSYFMVSVLLFYRRVRGDISLYNDSDDDIVNVPGAKLVWGPFHCPGIIGTAVNGYAIIYVTIVIFFSFWPSKMDPTVETMNWSVLAIGGSVFLAIIYYAVRARHVYNGPVVEISI
ncbi:Amino acid/polyamine transporter I [Penicillium griseofulvum]|uniref:Amino acid/polyamine transporter I n=1 Tax=Penicillium patulum TaxID=5078 RepID=A0A135L976_PENPA|nr:Amino acid/polyamine transporter I [Penicillium griseofulvum]KXG45519.1 Amino acid/polyamine transporter I [Penicillium griseofulvum]